MLLIPFTTCCVLYSEGQPQLSVFDSYLKQRMMESDLKLS